MSAGCGGRPPPAPPVHLRPCGVGLPGRGRPLRPSLFKFPRGTPAGGGDSSLHRPPLPIGPSRCRLGAEREEPRDRGFGKNLVLRGLGALCSLQNPRVSLGELVGSDGLQVKVFWAPRVPLRVSESLLSSGRGTAPALSSSGSLWPGPVTLLSPVTPNEAALKSLSGVQL